MNELIKIDKSEGGKDTCNARDLWKFLESKRDFSNWVNERIRSYDFVKEKDFTTNLLNRSTTGIGRGLKEYYISISMAKELCMVENNDKGKEARKYFIACENKLKEIAMPKTEIEWIEYSLKLAKEKEQLLIEKKESQPKVEFFDAVTDSKTAVEMSKVVKVLDLGIGRNKLFAFLREIKVLRYNNEPYQRYIKAGYFRVVEQKYEDSRGRIHIGFKTLVYQKGLDYIRKKFANK